MTRRATRSSSCHRDSLPWLSVQVGEGAADIRWHQIKEVRALKTVARQYDLICLRIETYDGRQVDLDEDLDGWEALIDALPRRLTGCRTWQDWWPEVAWPPLRETETVVFTR